MKSVKAFFRVLNEISYAICILLLCGALAYGLGWYAHFLFPIPEKRFLFFGLGAEAIAFFIALIVYAFRKEMKKEETEE